jgi:MFS family permease
MAGMRFLFGSRLLVGLLLTFSITVLGIGAVGVLFVPFVLGELGAPTAALGIIRASQVVGMVVTGAVVAGASKRVEPHRLLMLGMLGLGISLALTATVQNWVVLLLLLVFAGAWASTIQSSSSTLLQQGAPDVLRGRIESALDTLLTLVTMVGVGGAGALADRIGTRPTFLIAGALTLVGGLVAHFALRNTSSADSNAE